MINSKQDWRLLPLIVAAGLLIGWISGQLVKLLVSAEIATIEQTRSAPRQVAPR